MTGLIENIALSEASKEIAKPILRKLLENGTRIVAALKGDFSIQGQEITFACPENTQKWSVVFLNKKGVLSGKKSFLSTSIRKINVESLMPYKNVTNECINRLPEGGFELNYKRLNPNVPYLMNIESEIENPQFLESIVYKKVLDETPNEGKKKYWMEAQLKFTDVFEKMFSEIRVEELDFGVKVGTHEEIDTAVPRPFKRELDVVVGWMNEADHNVKHVLSQEHSRLLRARKGGGKDGKQALMQLIQDMQDVFMPNTFKSFLDIKKDFYYHDSLRGIDYYSAPFPTWPKFMTVVTRTDLTLAKPAANGYLEFNQADFRDKVTDVFSQISKK